MKRVLFLAHYFPPCRNVQSRLNLATALCFADSGWQVEVVAAEPPAENVDSCLDEQLGRFAVRRYHDPSRSAVRTAMGRVRGKLRIPRDTVLFPGVAGEIAGTAAQACRERRFDAVYSISAPAEAHACAAVLGGSIPVWIAEFQDPWLDNVTLNAWMTSYATRFWRARWKRRVSRTLERVMKSASLVVVESEGHRDRLQEKARALGADPSRVTCAYLGTDRRFTTADGYGPLPDLLRLHPGPVLGFLGSIYYGYEERALGLVRCLKDLEDAGRRFLFVTVGCPVLPELARKCGLRSVLSLHAVSYREALGIMAALTWGIVVPSSDININSKLFDYLMQGCPILVWGARQGEMARLVESEGWGTSVPDDAATARSRLDALIDGERPARLRRRSYSRREFFAPVLERIESLTGLARPRPS